MSVPWIMKNIGAALTSVFGAASSALAAGTGDATEVVGEIIDLQAQGNPESCVLAVGFTATLADTKTLSLGFDVDDGNNSALSDAAQFDTGVASAVVATGETGGTTEVGVISKDINLTGAKRYVRSQYTPDLSATGTDTAILFALWTFSGFHELPQ